jgi:hypothetical protein
MLRNGGWVKAREMRRAEGMQWSIPLLINAYLVPHTHVHMNCNIIKYLIKRIF